MAGAGCLQPARFSPPLSEDFKSIFFFFFVKFIHFLEKEVHTQPASSILPSDAWARA